MRALPLVAVLTLTLSAIPPAEGAVPQGCQEDYGSCKEDCTIEYGGKGRAITKLSRCMEKCQDAKDMCAARHSSIKEMRDMQLPDELADTPRKPAARPVRPGHADERVKELDKAREEDPFGDGAKPVSRRSPSDYDTPFEEDTKSAAKPAKVERQGYRATAPGAEPAPVDAEPTAKVVPASATEPSAPAATTRQGVYRASESSPPSPSPAVAPEPEGSLEPEPVAESKPAAKMEPPRKPEPAPQVTKAPPPPEKPAAPAHAERDPLLDDEPAAPPPPTAKKPPPSSRPEPPPEPKHDISDWDPGD